MMEDLNRLNIDGQMENEARGDAGSVKPSKKGLERRGLLGRVGAGAVGAAAFAAMTAGGVVATTSPVMAQAITDVDIFNFALNLEYVEAEYYLRAFNGVGLIDADTTGTGTRGNVTGGSAVPFRSGYIQQYAAKIATDEQVHVKFIRTVLGASAVARPAIDFTTSFTNLALAAGLIVPGQTFNPFADEISFLLGAFVFEDVGVTAYSGAAALITNKDLLSYAASVLAVEAYHAGAIRSILANLGGQDAVNKITVLRDTLSGGNSEQPLSKDGNYYNFVPTDQQGQTYRRTPRQVLNIAYGAANASSGLFFPAGFNGTIK